MPRLRRSSCAAPGIARRRRGRGFSYLDPAGETIDDPEVLERIAELAIPPAWREVWICIDELGHLQATGLDAAGRKQYLYHERWRANRDRQKYDSMVVFGERLPRLRRRVDRDLHAAGPPGRRPPAAAMSEELVLACAVRLLDLGFFRIGSEDYAGRNESYGLTTMLREHVTVSDEELLFDFPAKSGRRRVQAIADPQALGVISTLKRRRAGEQLLAYRNGRGWHEVHAEEVNDYVKTATGESFSAKDFRTWNATVLAAVALAGASDCPAARRDRAVTAAIKSVASYLGNTPAVCRASYVDPRVIDRYSDGETIAGALPAAAAGPDLARPRVRRRIERAVLELLS
ncbi:MAG TPA: DNA topoisomerase IB [Solirubrobacteraceae bacterium]|jgi:DNA topoisomerase IB|nr:DNA topoisomerase IB [Solirubrobacteraceae bacterium]